MPSMSSVTGSLLYAIGHMHDGGTDMRLYINSKLVCKSVMHYNARPGYGPMSGASSDDSMEGMAGMSHGHTKTKRQHAHGGKMHISDPGACTNFGNVRSGESLTAEVRSLCFFLTLP